MQGRLGPEMIFDFSAASSATSARFPRTSYQGRGREGQKEVRRRRRPAHHSHPILEVAGIPPVWSTMVFRTRLSPCGPRQRSGRLFHRLRHVHTMLVRPVGSANQGEQQIEARMEGGRSSLLLAPSSRRRGGMSRASSASYSCAINIDCGRAFSTSSDLFVARHASDVIVGEAGIRLCRKEFVST